MNADERRSEERATSHEPRTTAPDHSGSDMDICGDGIERPRVLIPEPGGIEPCPLKVDGDCPAGCDACMAFVEEMHHRDTEDTENGYSNW